MHHKLKVALLAVAAFVLLPTTSALAADDDIPGMPLSVGGSIAQMVDAHDADDVYSVTLRAGEEVHIRCDPGNSYTGTGIIHLLVPGAQSITEQALYDEISYTVMGGTPYVDKHGGYFRYIPPVTGTYHLWVECTEGTVDYRLSVARTDRASVESGADADDIPGTPVGSGAVTGVVSTVADANDVYSVTLAANQEATITVEPLTPFENYFPAMARVSLLSPGSTSIDTASGGTLKGPEETVAAASAGDRKTAVIEYTPSQAGTYYVWIQAGPFVDPSSDGYYGMNFAYRLAVSGSGGVSGGFSDLSGSPYQAAILDLAGRGVVSGFGDGTFRPNDPVTRQQFAKMIVKTLGYAVTGSEVCPFTDVATQTGSDPLYPSKHVAVCALRGITTGKTATTFAPNDKITRQQLITLVTRAAALAGAPAGFVVDFTAAQFSPAEHYQNAVKAAYAGLLEGLQGVGSSYDFAAAATRGECAQLLYNLVQRD